MLAIVAVGLQVLVLAYMAAEREVILRTGRVIHLRAAPVNPTDAMRSGYVRLGYQISQVPRSLCRDGLPSTNETPAQSPVLALKADTKVYASLRVEEDGLAELVSLSDRRPADGLFLRGRTEWNWGGDVRVRYGLEAFFMEQGKAAAVQEAQGREFRGVPLIVEAAVGRNGVAVLRNYRWDSLGLTLSVDGTNAPAGRESAALPRPVRQPASAVRAVLRNHGTNAVAILDLPGGRAFVLVPETGFRGSAWHWVGESNAPPVPRPEDVVVLKPGEAHTNRIDLMDPAWFVRAPANDRRHRRGEPQSVANSGENGSVSFQLEYRPSDRAACRNLPNAALIWHGRLPSARWWPNQRVD
jgi:uncharacterized membrane-anchored protein